MSAVLKLDNLKYSYDGKRDVIKGMNFEFEAGKIYAVVGKSGAGKSTLLSMLSGLAKPTGGEIFVNGVPVSKTDKYNYRSRTVGVIFQGFNLLPQLTAEENVVLSMDISAKSIPDKKQRARELLNKVGLDDDTIGRRILKLSGGEQQRVAIARALAISPDIILADEPTGNLDMGTQEDIINIFKDLAYNDNKCVIIVTHSPEVAKAADEYFTLAPLK